MLLSVLKIMTIFHGDVLIIVLFKNKGQCIKKFLGLLMRCIKWLDSTYMHTILIFFKLSALLKRPVWWLVLL